MGKASRWLRNLLAFKKPSPKPQPPLQYSDHPLKDKSRWSFGKSTAKPRCRNDPENEDAVAADVDPDKHAIAVAAATAAVAEAAVAAAKAAVAVVKLTSSGRCDSSSFYSSGRCGARQRWAAVVIQSAFRGYLARRALKALKALVRLQALVRGHIVRKQTADQVRQMQALLRVQARARAGRALLSESSRSSSRSSQHHHHDPLTPEKSEEVRSRSPQRNQPSALRVKSVAFIILFLIFCWIVIPIGIPIAQRNISKAESRGTIGQVRPIQGANRVNNYGMNDRLWDPLMKTCPSNDQLSDKILEVDPGKPYSISKQKNLFQASHHAWGLDNRSHTHTTSNDGTIWQAAPSSNLYEALPLAPINIACELEEASFCTAENSPRFYSASSFGGGSSRGGPFTPTKSDSFHSYLSCYSDYPNYMTYTESSKAKLRSMSAPKQRLQYERSNSTKRHSYHAVNDSKSDAQRLFASYSSFTSKAYPGSGRLDKLGMPVMRGDSHPSLH